MENDSDSVFAPKRWGEIIVRTRIRLHLTVKELYRATNMGPSTYTKLKKGTTYGSAVACASSKPFANV